MVLDLPVEPEVPVVSFPNPEVAVDVAAVDGVAVVSAVVGVVVWPTVKDVPDVI